MGPLRRTEGAFGFIQTLSPDLGELFGEMFPECTWPAKIKWHTIRCADCALGQVAPFKNDLSGLTASHELESFFEFLIGKPVRYHRRDV